MIFTKDLLLKGLAGLALCTGTAALGVHYVGGFSSLFGEVKIKNPQDQLGLPTGCNLPTGDAVTCNLTAENINTIKFEGKSDTATSVTGSGNPKATLEISIPSNDEKADFPHGYKFRLSVPTANTSGVLTINRNAEDGGNIVINAGESLDFKIKRNADQTFSLEKAWSAEDLAKKVGLENKDAEGKWSLDGKTIKIKHDGSPETKTVSPAQQGVTQGKIKAVADTSYNQGFKFVIEDGDIALTNGTGGENTITKLGELETYEIKKEGVTDTADWVLVRKTKAFDEIKKALVLPEECTMPNTSEIECTSFNETKLKAIKFKGKGDNEEVAVTNGTAATLKLKISKTADTNFTFGYKFVLESNKDITIPQGTGNTDLTIKADTNTEFKVKKTVTGGNTSLTLEKAWTVADLAKKVKLTNCTPEDQTTKQCDFGDSINVYDSASSKVTGATLDEGSRGKKLTYELGQEGHNQGIKFTTADTITLQGGEPNDSNVNISSGGSTSYQIKDMSGTWYLVKKNS